MAPPSPPPPPKTPATYLPLRWESTGDQWWYASPIDCAAANGHYDLVRELLRIDGNHLIKLTSLRRIRRLETVWDDDEQFRGAAKRRAAVARKLYHHCESKRKKCNSLVAAGYGGWLIYTAAAGGDLGFVQELLERNPLLVFGEGEYGVTDVMYAAARGKSAEVFRAVVEFAAVPRNAAGHGGEGSEISGEYKWEVMNRAVHAACRGGNLGILRELLINCFCSDHDILAYRDSFGSTLLHSAAARGQLEIVKYLIESYKTITTSRDHHGNTSLHVAAFRGQLSTAEALISASPSLIHLTNNSGDTFLHKAVLGFQTLQFRRLDRHLDLLNHLVLRRRRLLAGIINAANNDRRTALHVAVAGNSHSDHLVRILASAEGIDLNASDSLGLTPLDLLRQGPRSASGDVLIRRLLSAGAIFSGDNHKARQAIASRIRMHANDGGGSSSPGSCFRISDTEIFLHAGLETATTVPAPTPTFAAVDFAGTGSILSPASPEETSPYENIEESASNSYECYRRSSFNTAAAQIFKQVLNWPKLRDRKSKQKSMDFEAPTIDYPVQTNADKNSEWDPPPLAPLRKRFSKPTTTTTSNSNNKRSLAVRSNQSSPTLKKKKKKLRESVWRSSRSSSFSKMSSVSSPPSSSSEKLKGVCVAEDGSGGADVAGPSCSSNNGGGGSNSKRMKSQYYLCFGNAGTSVKSPVYRQTFKPSVSLVA